jgi:hypothetical protein
MGGPDAAASVLRCRSSAVNRKMRYWILAMRWEGELHATTLASFRKIALAVNENHWVFAFIPII